MECKNQLRSVVIFKPTLKYKTQIYDLLKKAENIDEVNVKGSSSLSRALLSPHLLNGNLYTIATPGHRRMG